MGIVATRGSSGSSVDRARRDIARRIGAAAARLHVRAFNESIRSRANGVPLVRAELDERNPSDDGTESRDTRLLLGDHRPVDPCGVEERTNPERVPRDIRRRAETGRFIGALPHNSRRDSRDCRVSRDQPVSPVPRCHSFVIGHAHFAARTHAWPMPRTTPSVKLGPDWARRPRRRQRYRDGGETTYRAAARVERERG